MNQPLDLSKIALIGVGRMGHGIAKSILRCGYNLYYLKHSGNQPDADLGGIAHDNFSSLCVDCNVVVMCVTGSEQVNAATVQPIFATPCAERLDCRSYHWQSRTHFIDCCSLAIT